MLAVEEGPFSAFSVIRRKVPAKTNAGRGIRCFNCLSVWSGMAIALVLFGAHQIDGWMVILCGFALSGGSIVIKWIEK